jgi:hypothetical protein
MAAGILLLAVFGCAGARSGQTLASSSDVRPGRSVRQTLERAIVLLERYECEVFAVDFLSPIRRAEIADLDAYRRERSCSPDDRGNLDDVLLALRLALGAEPEIRGVRAVIDLSGIGIAIQRLELVRYLDGRWYFNGF